MYKRSIITSLIINLALAFQLYSQEINDRLQLAYEATCRVSVQGGVGTGTIFKESDEAYFILTNAHVVDRSTTVSLEFTKGHYPSPKIKGTVIARRLVNGASFDVAVVSVLKKDLKGVTLPVIPLAKQGEQPDDLKYLTCGCQAGEMPSLQQVITTKRDGRLIYYKPPARPGRSGSSLVDVKAMKIYGLVAWTNGQEGLAMPADVIRQWIEDVGSRRISNFDEVKEVSFREDRLPPGAYPIPLAETDASYEKSLELQQCDPKSPWCPTEFNDNVQDPWSGGGNQELPIIPKIEDQPKNDPWGGRPTLPKRDNPPKVDPPQDLPKQTPPNDEFETKTLDGIKSIQAQLDNIEKIVQPTQEDVEQRRRLLDLLRRRQEESPRDLPDLLPKETPPQEDNQSGILNRILPKPKVGSEDNSTPRDNGILGFRLFNGGFFDSFKKSMGSTFGSVFTWAAIGAGLYFFVPPGYLGTLFWYFAGRVRLFFINFIKGFSQFNKGETPDLPDNDKVQETMNSFKDMISDLTKKVESIATNKKPVDN